MVLPGPRVQTEFAKVHNDSLPKSLTRLFLLTMNLFIGCELSSLEFVFHNVQMYQQ